MTKLIFLHIPKAGGTSLREAIASQIPEAQICPERFDRLSAWSSGDLDRFTFFSGHFSVGEIDRIPGEKRIATILREPAARLLSWYYFARSHTWFHIENHASELRSAKELGLLDYLMTEGPKIPTMVGMLGAGHLDLAKQRLNGMTAIGLLERADDSLLNITWRLGLEPMRAMPRLNVTGGRLTESPFEATPPEREPLTPKAIALLADLTRQDTELFAMARTLFASQLEECRAAFT